MPLVRIEVYAYYLQWNTKISKSLDDILTMLSLKSTSEKYMKEIGYVLCDRNMLDLLDTWKKGKPGWGNFDIDLPRHYFPELDQYFLVSGTSNDLAKTLSISSVDQGKSMKASLCAWWSIRSPCWTYSDTGKREIAACADLVFDLLRLNFKELRHTTLSNRRDFKLTHKDLVFLWNRLQKNMWLLGCEHGDPGIYNFCLFRSFLLFFFRERKAY